MSEVANIRGSKLKARVSLFLSKWKRKSQPDLPSNGKRKRPRNIRRREEGKMP